VGTENHNQKQPKKILQGFEIDTELDSYDIMPRKEKKRKRIEENKPSISTMGLVTLILSNAIFTCCFCVITAII
jgi:hypothetical protein